MAGQTHPVRLTRRELLALAGAATLSGCGGGGGSNPAPPPSDLRHYAVPPNSATITDNPSKVTVAVKDAAANTDVWVGEKWNARPTSRVINPVTYLEFQADQPFQDGQAIVSVPLDGVDPLELIGVQEIEPGVWCPLRPTINAGSATISPLIQPEGSRARLPKWVMKLGFTKIPYHTNLEETACGIVNINGQSWPPTTSFPAPLLYVHGMNNVVDDMRPIIDYVTTMNFRPNQYGLAYPWWDDMTQTAGRLAEFLNQLPANVRIDICAHSEGGLPVMYAIEKLGCSRHVRNLFILGTPRLGMALADDEGLADQLMARNLNDGNDRRSHWGRLRDLLSTASKQMKPSSDFLTALNLPTDRRLNTVDYYLTAGVNPNWYGWAWGKVVTANYHGEANDGLVPKSSVHDFNYYLATSGKVTKAVGPFNHSQLVTEPEAHYLLGSQLTQADLHIGLDPALSGGQPDDTGWSWTLTLTNNNDGGLCQPVSLSEIIIERFDRQGTWIETGWYDPTNPPTAPYPSNPVSLAGKINPLAYRQTRTITVHSPFRNTDETYQSVPDNLRAQTLVVTVKGTAVSTSDLTVIFDVKQTMTLDLKDRGGNPPSNPPRSVCPH